MNGIGNLAGETFLHLQAAGKHLHEPGKLADMVVLSDDPLAIEPMKIKDIKVMETIKEGKTVFAV